jgi:hypothetical protein
VELAHVEFACSQLEGTEKSGLLNDGQRMVLVQAVDYALKDTYE